MMSKHDDHQTLNAKLEDVLARLQSPDVRVDEAVELYEEGLKIVAALEKRLEAAENKIQKLKLQQEKS